jgi:predicted house-cleaning NTP pyrophosphatase (Maf/HAM1 superfamily)
MAQLFERIAGCHFAIVGLSLIPLLDVLRRRG